MGIKMKKKTGPQDVSVLIDQYYTEFATNYKHQILSDKDPPI
jgi:hypothetical protein